MSVTNNLLKKSFIDYKKFDPIEYGDFDNGQAVKRQLDFTLIDERYVSDERSVLELSPEAANLFLNVFDFDIEDAQAAHEAVTLSQLERGNIEKATASARDAKFRSIQFQNKIEQILRETKRDVSQLDWRDNVPKILDQVLAHIRGRIISEDYIIKSARDRITLMEPDGKEALQTRAVVELIENCKKRHNQLLGILISARSVFLNEQARQSFTMRSSSTDLPNLRKDILEILFSASKKSALTVIDGDECDFEGAMPSLLGIRVPEVFSVKQNISWLMKPPRDLSQRISLPNEKQTWGNNIIELPRYPFRSEQDELLQKHDKPLKLSSMLKTLVDSDEKNAKIFEYIALAVIRAFEDESAIDWRSERLAEDFECEEIWGNDFEIYDKKELEKDDLPE